MSKRAKRPPVVINLEAELHGHAICYANDQDRAWFEAHPDQDTYCRPPFEHELCDPRAAAAGRCQPVVVPAGRQCLVRVVQVAPGVRFRLPVVVVA
jgi:hypothetical protein